MDELLLLYSPDIGPGDQDPAKPYPKMSRQEAAIVPLFFPRIHSSHYLLIQQWLCQISKYYFCIRIFKYFMLLLPKCYYYTCKTVFINLCNCINELNYLFWKKTLSIYSMLFAILCRFFSFSICKFVRKYSATWILVCRQTYLIRNKLSFSLWKK